MFPQSAQTSKPWLETWLRDRHHDRAKVLIEADLDRDAGGDDTRIQSAVVEALQVNRLELDPGREYLDEPWIRQMPTPRTMAEADPRRGIYPGTAYRVPYDRYRLRLISGGELVTLSANGGPALLDPTFDPDTVTGSPDNAIRPANRSLGGAGS